MKHKIIYLNITSLRSQKSFKCKPNGTKIHEKRFFKDLNSTQCSSLLHIITVQFVTVYMISVYVIFV